MPMPALFTPSIFAISIVALLAIVGPFSVPNNSVADELAFEQHVRPIFKAQCFHCHGEEEELPGGLDVRLVRLMVQGDESGESIVPGDPDASLLWQRIDSDEMPEGEKKLTPEQKATVRNWIQQGAKTARPEPDNVEDAKFTFEELSHWAFQLPEEPPIPKTEGYATTNPIDRFIASRLMENRLPFSPEAGRRTLIRRATFDLLGLPPTPEEVNAFVTDYRPDAYERLIDRLLSSPQFGVRWGRHWLDIAGFAESDGGQNSDPKREHACRYRNYVVDCFNHSKPVDEFLREQLAGDELIEGEIDVLDDRQRELLTATGFLRMAPDPTQSSNSLADRNMAAADAVKVISETMLGVTVGCAQCHDHKYDPIGIDDYYRFRAIFDPVFPLKNWQQPKSRLVDLTSDESKAEAERIEAIAKKQTDEINQRRNQLGQEILDKKLSDVPVEDRDATRAAVLKKPQERTDRDNELLDSYPMVKPASFIAGFLIEYDMPSYRKFEQELKQVEELRATKPPKRLIMATQERAGVIPTSTVFFRGNPESPRDEVFPAELTVLQQSGTKTNLPTNDEKRKSTGRRLAYAKHLTNGRHPLTARVFVNRIWMHHFGKGLVSTPSDFGIAGERPSHPMLLDWLAADFVKHGWDQKRIHRMILLSTTYRQQSVRTSKQDAIDPENRLLARMNLRRLDAESIRDAILTVSSNISLQLGGMSVPVTVDASGKTVIGEMKIRDGLPAGVDESNADAFRRSTYIEVQRSLPLNMLATFDQPVMNPNCDLRRHSTVSTQALWFMNDAMVVGYAQSLAERVSNISVDRLDRINALFEILFSDRPDDGEFRRCCEFIDRQTTILEKNKISKDRLEVTALATLCHTMMASNRFLYID